MTIQQIKDLFPKYVPKFKSPDGLYDKTDSKHWGSKRKARHAHNPTWLPALATMSPAKWKRARRKTRVKKW